MATELLHQRDLKKRVALLKKFIHLGKECMDLHNYFSMFAVYVGLNLTPVQRIKKTWEQLSPRTRQVYEELERACDPSRNMKGYRDLLAHSRAPIIPFIRML